MTILNLTKIAENSRNMQKTLWEKGEIARYEQFLLFPQVFSNDLYERHVKSRACLGKDEGKVVCKSAQIYQEYIILMYTGDL